MIDFYKVLNNKSLGNYKNNLQKGCRQVLSGLSPDVKGLFLALAGKGSVFVVKDIVSAGKIAEQASALGLKCSFILNGYEDSLGLVDHFAMSEFLSALYDFATGEIDVLLVSVEALFQKSPTKQDLLDNVLNLKKDNSYNFKQLVQSLIQMGYNRVEFASRQGQFSLKGDILEIFAINHKNLIRLEFFDEQIERISIVTVEEKTFIKEVKSIKVLSVNQPQSDFNLLSFADNVFFDEPKFLEDEKNNHIKSFVNINESKSANSYNYVDENLIFNCKAKNQIAFVNIGGESFFSGQTEIDFKLFGIKNYFYDLKELIKDINFFTDNGISIFLFCGSEAKKQNLDKFLTENYIFSEDLKNEFKLIPQSNAEEDKRFIISEKNKWKNETVVAKTAGALFVPDKITAFAPAPVLSTNVQAINQKGKIYTLTEKLPFSIAFVNADAILIGTYNLFVKDKKEIRSKKKSIYAPKAGEFVVHNTHGVGKCIGAKKLKLTEYEKDYFIIEYASGDKFYLPSEQADDITPFYGSDDPELNKLGSSDFENIKNKVYKNVKKLAFSLLELYSKRENSKGFIYNKDDYLMEMFENAFQYEETPDQASAITDVKNDMESPRIMDRLICGDAGYGKTEVALRAVYKAVLSGRQVAFLCPTTILAEQHYQTCQKRFSGFMVKVAKLTRLVKPKECSNILHSLENGEIDIVCGTHKLLGKNVKFKNLGLLVLDEEQRFGVEHKETIKNLKVDIDVLTLSATPIPRTLHMSLSGIRDISIIETPPQERMPVQTFVTEFNENLIINACKQELARGGQVLILFNRVEHIYKFAGYVENLLPEIKIGVAHGQLSQKLLEDAILKLYNREYQVLIATTLIENGIDLPNANTLIVIDSDRLGLAQLYQLRGRIGRSNKPAYAYFTYQGDKILTEKAYQRLDAIVEFTQSGSGLKIAMRDLDIRGVGNVLGKEQHGSMEKVGYYLYCRLLENALKEIKGEKLEFKKEIKLDINLNAYISEEYIESETDRIKKYSQISGLDSMQELESLKSDIQKTYGTVPAELENLMLIALMKNLAVKENIQRVLITQKLCRLFVYKSEEIISEKLSEKLKNNSYVSLIFEKQPIISFNNETEKIKKKLTDVINFLI